AGAAAQAIPILREAVGQWEALVEKAGGRSWEELLASPDPPKATTALGNLSATIGDLANALNSAGRHDEALAVAEKCLGIQEKLGNQRDVAAAHGQCAAILMALGRSDEADTRYDLALAAARQVGDKELEGSLLQHQGILARKRNRLDRALLLYQQALQRFRQANNEQGVMQIYNSLGLTEKDAG